MASLPDELTPIPEAATSKDSTASQATTEVKKSIPAPGSQPPPGYKFVKVRKADGSIATVKRKLTPEEATAAGVNLGSTVSADSQINNFRIVTVRKPDGTLVKVKRAINTDNGDASGKTTPHVTKDVPAKALSAEESSSRSLDTPDETTTSPMAPSGDSGNLGEALADQRQYQRARKMHRFKTSLARGLGTVVAGALPSIHIGDFHDGDEIVSDDDLSDDDGDDDIHGTDHGGHDNHSIADNDALEKGHSHNDDDHSQSHFSFDGGAAAGGIASAMAATAAGAPPTRAPPAYSTTAKDGANASEKVTFKVTAKELNIIEQKAAEKEAERSLHRHWANFSFYFMASLSIILPALFLILAGFIIGMKGKSAYGNWSKMENAIKVAISAWPIVFAAVTAQCFKSWATYKVERGIKLMELEQLVGSNSFGSAMKQPFLLRRLDLLSLFLFAIWCLSPVGSQALQRAYSIKRDIQQDNVEVYYLNMNGDNEIWGLSTTLDSNQVADYEQIIATDYIGNLSPDPVTASMDYDRYERPLVTFPFTSTPDYPDLVAGYGVPVALPLIKVGYPNDTTARERDNPPSESLNFTMTTSFFAFTCDDWSIRTKAELDNSTEPFFEYSNAETLALAFTYSDASLASFDGVAFASLNKAPELNRTKNDTSGLDIAADAEYSYIECSLTQVYVDTQVSCVRDVDFGTATCGRVNVSEITQANTTGFKGTELKDFSFEWTYTGSPDSLNVPSTPTEMYISDTGKQDGLQTAWYNSSMNLSEDTWPTDFATRFGYLFNTWVSLGYCTLCLSIPDIPTINELGLASHYTKVNAVRQYSEDLIYTISAPWVAVFVTCTAVLLFAGTISVVVESMTVAPDVLGYVSTVARNSRYLHLPKTNSAMSGGERARQLGGVKVMMQDVKANADVGKIALGLKHESAERLKAGRLYR